MDPTEIESLERTFWVRLAAGLLVGVLALAFVGATVGLAANLGGTIRGGVGG